MHYYLIIFTYGAAWNAITPQLEADQSEVPYRYIYVWHGYIYKHIQRKRHQVGPSSKSEIKPMKPKLSPERDTSKLKQILH